MIGRVQKEILRKLEDGWRLFMRSGTDHSRRGREWSFRARTECWMKQPDDAIGIERFDIRSSSVEGLWGRGLIKTKDGSDLPRADLMSEARTVELVLKGES